MRRSTLLVAVLGAIVVTALWWLLVVGGVDERVADAEAEASTLELQQATLERRLVELQDAAQSSGAYARAIEDIEESVPDRPTMDAFIEDLNALAERRGVDIIAVGTSEPRPYTGEPEADVLVIDMDLAVEAQFFELLAFLFDLEDLPRLVVVETISISPGGSANEESPSFEPDVLTVNMTASLFARESEVVAGSGGGG